MSRFFNSWYFNLLLSVFAITIIIAVMFDAIAIEIIGHSVWFPYPK